MANDRLEARALNQCLTTVAEADLTNITDFLKMLETGGTQTLSSNDDEEEEEGKPPAKVEKFSSKVLKVSTTVAYYYRIPKGVELADDGKNYSISKDGILIIKTADGEIKMKKAIKYISENANEVDEMEDFGLDESDFE